MADLSMIVRMVIYKCRELNNPVTETLAAYVAQTTLNGRKLSKKHKTWPFFLVSYCSKNDRSVILYNQKPEDSISKTRSQRKRPKNWWT